MDILGEEHLLLLEILYNKGEMHLSDIDTNKFKYLSKSVNTLLKKGVLLGAIPPFASLSNWGHIEINYATANIDPTKPIVRITKKGKEYLRGDIQRRKQRFACHSPKLEQALCAQIGGYPNVCTPFERDVLISHNCLTPNNKFTRVGEQYFLRSILKFITEAYYSPVWSAVSGPDEFLYTGNYSNRNWREIVKADFNLLHSVKGVGVTLIPALSEPKRKYPGILLLADTYEEAIVKIRQAQQENPDHFIFCED